MALDATPGGESADSFCTVEEADAYHDARAFNAEWAAADASSKERHLKWATSLLDAHYSFIGARGSSEQALSWPREGVELDGVLLSATVVPRRVRQATAEFALRLMREDWSEGLGSVTDEGVQVGPLRTSRETHNPIPAQVEALLAPLVEGGTGDVHSVELVLG